MTKTILFRMTDRRKMGAALLLLLVAAGCNSGRVEQVLVQGRVTLDGGVMPGPGSVLFTSVDSPDGIPQRPATASFKEDGAFKAGTFKPGDGLFPGKYRVAFECWEVPPGLDDRPSVSFLSEKFASPETSGFELEVPSGSGPITWNIDLKTK